VRFKTCPIGPRPVKVLVVAATPYFADRGCHVRIQGQALALERKGVEVTIVTYGHGRDVQGGRIERIRRLPGATSLDAAPRLSKLPLDLLLLLRTIGVARRLRPALLHGHTQEGAAIALVAGRVLGLKVVADLQSRRVAEELEAYGKARPGSWLHRLADRFDHAIPRRAQAVLASTPAIAAFVASEARPRGPVEVLADAAFRPAS
jgi:hypothetical protein